MGKDFLGLADVTSDGLVGLLDFADEIKAHTERYADRLKGKTLLLFFEKPSLRTRLSFEVGVRELGADCIYYHGGQSPMGEKESVADTAKTSSRYVDLIAARLYSHDTLKELAEHASIPVINALTDESHPCQALADLMSIREKKKTLDVTLAYVGDADNNVTRSLITGCAKTGVDMRIGAPKGYLPGDSGDAYVTEDPFEAVEDADIVYTDSWMSYHIPETEKEKRLRDLSPYRVTRELMSHAREDALFMHCLPAQRGIEVEADVIDSQQSIVFDQAENRLHTQKALMIFLGS